MQKASHHLATRGDTHADRLMTAERKYTINGTAMPARGGGGGGPPTIALLCMCFCLCVRELLLSQLPAVNHHVAISKQCRASTANQLLLSRTPMLVGGSSNRVRRHTADTADSNSRTSSNSKQPAGMPDTVPGAGPVRPAGVSSNSNDKMPVGIRTNLSNRNRRGIISRGGSRSRSRSLPPRGLRAVTFPPHRLHRGRPQLLSSSRHSPPVYSTRPRR